MMYRRRAFVHWYLKEGMEYEDFKEARLNLENMEQDYEDVLAEQCTDEWDTDY